MGTKKTDSHNRRIEFEKDARSFSGIAKEFIDNINSDELGLYAAQSTFFIILSAVPFIMLVILCLKYFIDLDLYKVTEPIVKMLPAEIAQYIVQIISEVFRKSQSLAVFSAAFVTLLWSSSKGTMAIYCGLNKIYGSHKQFSWLRMRILSLIYNILFIVLIIASAVVLLFGNSIVSFLDSEFMVAHYMISFIIRFKAIIFFVFLIMIFAGLFTFLPQKKNKYRRQLLGAAVTSAGWIVISYGISIYLRYFPRFSYIYGSLTALMFLMLWLYFCMYMILIGAEINKHSENGYFRRVGMRILRRRVKRRKKM